MRCRGVPDGLAPWFSGGLSRPENLLGFGRAALKRGSTRRTVACYRRTTLAENRLESAAAQPLPGKLQAMARCVKTPTKDSSRRQLSPLKAAQDHKSPIKPPPRRRLGGAGCFRRCSAPAHTEGLQDDLDGTPLRPATPETSSDPPRLMDAIAAYNKLMDAEEALVEVVGLDGLRRHRRRRDVSARAEINIYGATSTRYVLHRSSTRTAPATSPAGASMTSKTTTRPRARSAL